MATVTGTVLIPSREAAEVDPAVLSGTSSGPVPVAFARVQALDGSLRPIPSVPETRTDAGGHFALDVPTGRPYILRFQVGATEHPLDLLAVADPTDGSGAQVITVDAAMHVATQLLLDRTDGLDSALDAVGAGDVRALVDAVRQTLSGQPVDLASAKSVDDVAQQEAQAGSVENVLDRVGRAASQATAAATVPATASDLAVMSSVASGAAQVPPTTGTPTATAAVPVATVASPVPTPAPPPAAAVALAPTPAATPQARSGPDRRSLEWAKEFSYDLGPAVDPFRAALERAGVSIVPLAPHERRRVVSRAAHPVPVGSEARRRLGPLQTSVQRIARAVPLLRPAPVRHPLWTLGPPVVAPTRPRENGGTTPRYGASVRAAWWRGLVFDLFGWLPALRLPTLPSKAARRTADPGPARARSARYAAGV